MPTVLSQAAKSIWTARAAIAGLLLCLGVAGAASDAHAQAPIKPPVEAAPQAVPGFWDPRRRPERPDLSRLTVIRFLTETDYPPFNFTGPDGNPAVITIFSALSGGDVEISLGETDASGTPVTFTGYSSKTDPGLAPWAIERLTPA